MIKIIRSKRKTLSLSLDRQTGEPVVRAPRTCPDEVIARFLEAHKGWIKKQQENFKPPKVYTPEEIAALRAKAKAYLPGRAAYYAPLMGVSPTGLRITAARTRYGSCSAKGAICFSLFLMEKDEEFIDYVVVHELAHLRHMNHSPAFYKEIEKILPNYQELDKQRKRA